MTNDSDNLNTEGNDKDSGGLARRSFRVGTAATAAGVGLLASAEARAAGRAGPRAHETSQDFQNLLLGNLVLEGAGKDSNVLSNIVLQM